MSKQNISSIEANPYASYSQPHLASFDQTVATQPPIKGSDCLTSLEEPDQKQEIFPYLPREETFLEQSSHVNFNRSFLYEKKTDFEHQLLHSDQGRLIQIANCILQMLIDEQRHLFESFKTASKKLRYIQADKSKVLHELAENAQLEDYWRLARSLTNYLSTGLGILIGLGSSGVQVYRGRGDFSLIQSGIATICGGIISAGSEWMSQRKYNQSLTDALSLCGSLIVGSHVVPQSFFPKRKIDAFQILSQIGSALSQYQIAKTRASEHTINEKLTHLQHYQEKNKNKISTFLNRLNLRELIDQVKVLSDQIKNEDELKEQITKIISLKR